MVFIACVAIRGDGTSSAHSLQPRVEIALIDGGNPFSDVQNVIAEENEVTIHYRDGASYMQRVSEDYGLTFAPATLLPDDRYPVDDTQELVSGGRTYQVWEGDSSVFFRRSDDGGDSWTEALEITDEMGFFDPKLTARGDHVYIVHSIEAGFDDQIVLLGSMDAGDAWSPPIEIGEGGLFGASALPAGGVVAIQVDEVDARLFAFPTGIVTDTPVVTVIESSEHLPGNAGTSGSSDMVQAGPNDGAAARWGWGAGGAMQAEMVAVTRDGGQTWNAHKLNVSDRTVTGGLAAGEDDEWFASWTERAADPSQPQQVFLGGTVDGGDSLLVPRLLHTGDVAGNVASSVSSTVVATADVAHVFWLDSAFGTPTLLQMATVDTQDNGPAVVQTLDDTHFGTVSPVVHKYCPPGRICAGPNANAREILYLHWSGRATSEQASRTLFFMTGFVTGDANCDGAVDTDDLLSVLEQSAQLRTHVCIMAADLNCDGLADVKDAVLMLTSLANAAVNPPADCPIIHT
jgi:hypothetical protein